MRKSEALSLLAAYVDAKELYTINEEYTRVKFLMKSLSSRKGIQEAAVEEIIKAFRKVRIGSVINTLIKVSQMREGVVIPENKQKNADQYTKRINTYVTEVVSLADRLLAGCIDILSTLSSSRTKDNRREEAQKRTLSALDAIIEKTTKTKMGGVFDAMLTLLKVLAEQTEEKEEKTVEQAENKATEASDGVIYVDLSGTDDEDEEGGTEAVREEIINIEANGRDTDAGNRLAS